MPISIERDMDCRLFIISSDDGKAVAWRKAIHFSDGKEVLEDAQLTEVAIPNRVFLELFGTLPKER